MTPQDRMNSRLLGAFYAARARMQNCKFGSIYNDELEEAIARAALNKWDGNEQWGPATKPNLAGEGDIP